MRVILYQPDFTRPGTIGWITTTALSEGLTTLGIKHSVRRCRNWEKDGSEIADVCVLNGWWKKFIDGRPATNRNVIIKAQEAAGKPAWCIERGFLLDRDKDWSALSIGGFCTGGSLGGARQEDGTWSGEFRAVGMPPDRWIRMGLELKPWRTGGEYILLCAQVPWDSQVQRSDHVEWLAQTIQEIRKHTDRPIVFRGHPKAWRQANPYHALSKPVLKMVKHSNLACAPTTTFEEDFEGAHAVVTFNSNVATLCNVAGVPVFTGAACLADPIAIRGDWTGRMFLEALAIDPLPRVVDGREQWAYDLAYKQWTVEEFRKALPWMHLMRPAI